MNDLKEQSPMATGPTAGYAKTPENRLGVAPVGLAMESLRDARNNLYDSVCRLGERLDSVMSSTNQPEAVETAHRDHGVQLADWIQNEAEEVARLERLLTGYTDRLGI